MTELMDYMISPLPIRIADQKVDPSKLKVTGLQIMQVGYLPGRTLRRENVSFDHWALVYIVGGKGTLQVHHPHKVVQIESGSLFFVYPGISLSYGPDKNGYWDEYYIRFEGKRINEWLESSIIRKDINLKNVGVNPEWIKKVELIYSYVDSGLSGDVDRAALLLESFIFEFHLWESEEAEKKSTLYLSILEDLAKNLYHTIDAGYIADRHHISVSTLRRLIKQNTGYPLHEYWHRLKIEEAKKLLVTTNYSVKEIALRLGYQDPYYFSRLFKKLSGNSALHYRRQF
jgi:AraC family transcriptional regulator of arabinose operon